MSNKNKTKKSNHNRNKRVIQSRTHGFSDTNSFADELAGLKYLLKCVNRCAFDLILNGAQANAFILK